MSDTTTGTTSFTTAGLTPTKNSFPPVPAQDWDATLLTNTVELLEGQASGVPYVKCAFELANSGLGENGKNRRIYHTFWLGMKPDKNGVISAKRNDGLVGFARAIGVDLDAQTIKKTITTAEGNSETQEFIDPRAVIEFLRNNGGASLRLHSRVKNKTGKDRKPTGEKEAVVDYFIATEGTVSFQ